MEQVLFDEDDEALRLTQSLCLQRVDVDVVTARDCAAIINAPPIPALRTGGARCRVSSGA